MRLLPASFFEGEAPELAPKLLGKIIKKGPCEGIVVEVEAYAADAASHAAKKPNQGRLMRETIGHWYVYFTYGMHYCVNVTCDKAKAGGILIRAVEAQKGIKLMRERRGLSNDIRATRPATGPACVTQAFGIGRADNGRALAHEFGIFDAPAIPAREIVAGPRIGIRAAVDLPWRFYIKNNPFVSKLPKRTNRSIGASRS